MEDIRIYDWEKVEAELLKANRRERLLTKVASRLLTNDDPQGIIDELCKDTMEYMDCQVFFNYLVNPEMNCLHLNAWAGIPREEAIKIEWLEFGAAVCGCAAQEGCRIVAENIGVTPDPRTDLVRSYGVQAYACHPLMIGEEVLGTISFGTCSRPSFTEDELALMKTVSDHISMAISRLLVNRELKKSEQRLESLVQERTRELEESNQTFSKILESITDAFFTIDRTWKVTYWNGAAEQMFNVTRDEVLGRVFWEVFNDFVGSEFYYEFNLAMRYDIPVYFVAQGGYTDRWVEARAYPSPSGLTIYLHDITARKLAEDELRNSEERFYRIFNNNPDMMAIQSMQDNIYVDVNQKFIDFTGYSRDEIIGKTPEELQLVNPDPGFQDRSLLELEEKGEIHNIEYRLRTKWGDVATVCASTVVLNLNGDICRIAIMKDLTREKKMEAEIARLDRLNLIGEMAASIGHEIRNPMTAVRGFLQILCEKDKYNEDRDYFDLMIEELDRANAIISEYLGMAKNKEINLQLKQLDEIVQSLGPMIHSTAIKKDMNLKLELARPPYSLVDENEIRQLILNIARNGFEAMQPGGTLTIGTTEADDEVILYISDQGHGLDIKVLEKLGTPFVTTKDEGTGLGLAVCYSIAARHRASIELETGPSGTTFYIRFPTQGDVAVGLPGIKV